LTNRPTARTNRTTAELWSIEDVSEFLRVPVGTLYQWRYRRIGPRAFKVGRHLRYDPADVRSWLAGMAA
jgi:predicted DNA-binding transcriptional regulator AlpA